MPNLANPDMRRLQRNFMWANDHVVALPAVGTIESGDLVYTDDNGRAVAYSGTPGAVVDTTSTGTNPGRKVYGVAMGRTAVIAADPDLYSRILVAPIEHDDLVVMRKVDSSGNGVDTLPSDVGKTITLRYGAGSLQGIVGAYVRTSSDTTTVHGHVVDIYSSTHLIVKFTPAALTW